MSTGLYPSPYLSGGEVEAFAAFAGVAADPAVALNVVDYQLFTGMGLTHEPLSAAVEEYLVAKHAEELGELIKALRANDQDNALEEFGDLSWVTFSAFENAVPLGSDRSERLQLAPFLYRALNANGIMKVECEVFDDGVVIPTIGGVSRADLGSYRPVFYGPLRRTAYLKNDAKSVQASTDEEVFALVQAEFEAWKEVWLAVCNKGYGKDALPYYEDAGYRLANMWLLMAGVLQRHFGSEAVSNAIRGNIVKVAGRVATGTVVKADRQANA